MSSRSPVRSFNKPHDVKRRPRQPRRPRHRCLHALRHDHLRRSARIGSPPPTTDPPEQPALEPPLTGLAAHRRSIGWLLDTHGRARPHTLPDGSMGHERGKYTETDLLDSRYSEGADVPLRRNHHQFVQHDQQRLEYPALHARLLKSDVESVELVYRSQLVYGWDPR